MVVSLTGAAGSGSASSGGFVTTAACLGAKASEECLVGSSGR